MASLSQQLQCAPWSVAIAGAGLSGLCLAQGLFQAGFDVHVYERDPSPQARRQGYRITLDHNGAHALKRCLSPQLFELVLATTSAPEEVGYFRFTNQQLGEIFRLTFRRDTQRTQGAIPEVLGQVDRATLRTILLANLEERVHFGKTVSHVETDATGAVVHFAEGDATRADLVVGADGVHSALREQLLLACPLIDTGYCGIYGKTALWQNGISLVPQALEHSGVFAIGAPGHGFFFTAMRFNESPQPAFARLVPDLEPPIGDDYVMWAVLLPRQALPADVWAGDPKALHEAARAAARGFHPVLRRFVERAEIEFTVAVTLHAATRPKEWPVTHATLMGDAVHVMPPLGAQGGNTALRDAALLVDKLQDAAHRGETLAQAIKTYQQEMIAYAFKEVASSTAMLRRGTTRNPLVRFATLRAVPWVRSLVGSSLEIK